MQKSINAETIYCVIIPTYNNDRTLKIVIDGVIAVFPAEDIIIINDGSTDYTTQILKEYSTTTQVHLTSNSGKGVGLRSGFKKALELGYTHAITIDSDGQHYPEDIPKLLVASKETPTTLYIGSRNMAQEGVPSKSNFGNKFSNFWFW